MTATRVDVLVIGGGPARSTASCLLARAGLAVSRAAMNRKAARRRSGELPAAPACDVQEKDLLRQGLPFGKFG